MYRADAAPNRSLLITAFNSTVFGVDRQTGQIVWHRSVAQTPSTIELAIMENVVVAIASRSITFLDYATGMIHKATPVVGEYLGARPVCLIDGPHIYVGANGELSCYTSRGDLVWVQPFTGHGFGSLALGLPGNIRQADSVGSR